MTDFKVGELKKALLHTAKRRNFCTNRRKYLSYGLHPSTSAARFQPARIVECTQNVVEIRKLINDFRKLETAEKASLDKIKREKYALETQYYRLIGAERDYELQDSFQLEPGFRFKANGDIKKPKKHDVTDVVKYIKNWKGIKKNMHIQEIRGIDNYYGLHEHEEIDFDNNSLLYRVDSKNMYGVGDIGQRPPQNTDSMLGTVNVTEAIAETEEDLKEIYDCKELVDMRASSQYLKDTSSTYLRAFSRENQYSGGPDKVKSYGEMKKAWDLKDAMYHNKSGFKRTCPACEIKHYSRKNFDHTDQMFDRVVKKSQSINASEGKIPNRMISQDCTGGTSNDFSHTRMVQNKYKYTEDAFRPTSMPNITGLDMADRQTNEIAHTKSAEGNSLQICGNKLDCRNSKDEITPERGRKTKFISHRLKHGPSSIPKKRNANSKNIEGITGKSINEGVLKATEALYHQLLEKHSITSKDNLDLLKKINPGVYTDIHLKENDFNTEVSRHIDNTSGKQIEQALERGLSNNKRGKRKARKAFVPLEIFKEMAEVASKESESRVNSFIEKLPPPQVSIERWRTVDGVNRSIHESYTDKDRPINRVYNTLLKNTKSDLEKDPYVVNTGQLLRELDECKRLAKKHSGVFEPTNYDESTRFG